MRWRRLVLVLIGCAAVAGALLLFHNREPRYEGKPLSYWLLAIANNEAPPHERQQAAAAVRHIGPRALPFLLEWIGYKEPRWSERIRQWYTTSTASPPPAVFKMLTRLVDLLGHNKDCCEIRAIAAVDGFVLLGPQAAPAIPKLVGMVDENILAFVLMTEWNISASVTGLPGRCASSGPTRWPTSRTSKWLGDLRSNDISHGDCSRLHTSFTRALTSRQSLAYSRQSAMQPSQVGDWWRNPARYVWD
jgi:hypothetical protein